MVENIGISIAGFIGALIGLYFGSKYFGKLEIWLKGWEPFKNKKKQGKN